MSRSGYSEDIDGWDLIRWRGQVASAIKGKRGQEFLTKLVAALDAMPVKALIRHELESEQGEVCTLGALGKHRGLDMDKFDPYDHAGLANVFNVAHQLIQEIEYENDDFASQSPEERWTRMRKWAVAQIRTPHA